MIGFKIYIYKDTHDGKFGKKQYFLPEIYAVAFRVFSLLLPEFAIAFSRNSDKSNGKIWAKAIRKLGKRRDIFRAKIMEVLGNFTN